MSVWISDFKVICCCSCGSPPPGRPFPRPSVPPGVSPIPHDLPVEIACFSYEEFAAGTSLFIHSALGLKEPRDCLGLDDLRFFLFSEKPPV